jgi:murein L,D-transpeptidase YcbB/YkuD
VGIIDPGYDPIDRHFWIKKLNMRRARVFSVERPAPGVVVNIPAINLAYKL